MVVWSLVFLHPSGNPRDAGQQEAAPRRRVPVTPSPFARGGGEPEGGGASKPGARGRDPQYAFELGRRTGRAGTQALDLGRCQTHHLVASERAGGPKG